MEVLGFVVMLAGTFALGWICNDCWKVFTERRRERKAETKRLRDTSSGEWVD